MSLVAVGTVAFDNVETPYGKADMIVGGAATYISLAASYFLNDVKICSVVGDDFPDEELKFMESRGIDLEGLQVKVGEKSFFWAGKYHDNMNKRDTLDTQLNVLADFNPILPDSYTTADFVMLGNLTPEIQMQVIDQMTKRPKMVVMDTMNFWMDIAMESLKKTIAKVDVLVINDEEARQLSEKYSLVEAAEVILEMGPTYLVIKKGEHGALLFDKDSIFSAPALPLAKVFDPTGAGDTFAGGFIGYLAKTGDTSFANMKKAIIYGSVMASFCVEEFGIKQLKGLDEAKIADRYQRFVDLASF